MVLLDNETEWNISTSVASSTGQNTGRDNSLFVFCLLFVVVAFMVSFETLQNVQDTWHYEVDLVHHACMMQLLCVVITSHYCTTITLLQALGVVTTKCITLLHNWMHHITAQPSHYCKHWVCGWYHNHITVTHGLPSMLPILKDPTHLCGQGRGTKKESLHAWDRGSLVQDQVQSVTCHISAPYGCLISRLNFPS